VRDAIPAAEKKFNAAWIISVHLNNLNKIFDLHKKPSLGVPAIKQVRFFLY
jgi:hypothetical protein